MTKPKKGMERTLGELYAVALRCPRCNGRAYVVSEGFSYSGKPVRWCPECDLALIRQLRHPLALHHLHQMTLLGVEKY